MPGRVEGTTLTTISRGVITTKDSFVLQTREFKLFKTQFDTILSCSIGYNWNDCCVVYEFNDKGAVYGPNGELQLDPDIPPSQCGYRTRPVFATCKNNCPGGELSVISSDLFCNNYRHIYSIIYIVKYIFYFQ